MTDKVGRMVNGDVKKHRKTMWSFKTNPEACCDGRGGVADMHMMHLEVYMNTEYFGQVFEYKCEYLITRIHLYSNMTAECKYLRSVSYLISYFL